MFLDLYSVVNCTATHNFNSNPIFASFKCDALYYCTIILRDALKLQIPREKFFIPRGEAPRDEKFTPEGFAISMHPEKWSCSSISIWFTKQTKPFLRENNEVWWFDEFFMWEEMTHLKFNAKLQISVKSSFWRDFSGKNCYT